MSCLTLAPRYSGASVGLFDDAMSEAAETVRNRLDLALRHFNEPISSGSSRLQAESDFRELEIEAAVDDWDMPGSQALNPLSIRQARQFVALLPTWMPTPHVSADPDGEVALEWVTGPKWGISISFGAQTVAFAALLGINRLRGTTYFGGDEIPPALIRTLREVVGA